MTPAFASPSSLALNRLNHAILPPKHSSNRCVCTLQSSISAPPVSDPSNSSHNQLKKRSIVTLRAFSDIGGLTLLAELAHRFALTASPTNAFMADCELLLGGLIGIWTVSAFADRLSNYTSKLISQSNNLSGELVQAWDKSFIYPSLSDNIQLDEIQPIISLLYSFDEIEGLETIKLLKSLSLSNDVRVRIKLLNSLALFPVRTNITLSIILNLANDYNVHVKNAAIYTLLKYEKEGIVTFNDLSSILPNYTPTSQDLLFYNDNTTLDNQSLWKIKNILNCLLNDPSPIPVYSVYHNQSNQYYQLINEIVEKQVNNLKDMALSCPDLSNLSNVATSIVTSSSTEQSSNVDSIMHEQFHSIAFRQQQQQQQQQKQQMQQQQQQQQQQQNHQIYSSVNKNNKNRNDSYQKPTVSRQLPAPLVDSLCTQEIHGICALALIPTAYELFAVIQHEPLPLRFLGLGWLFSIGGLAAYPNSANLWSSLSRTIERLPRVRMNNGNSN